MNTMTDEDLILLYYGEHDDPELAARVAGSAALSGRFTELSEKLEQADTYLAPERQAGYGEQTWRRIAPRLAPRTRRSSWRLLELVHQPRLSFATALAMSALAVLAVLAWRSDEPQPVPAVTGIDTERLLEQSVSRHLDRINLELTRFVNSDTPSGSNRERALDMLLENRLYRHSATAQGDTRLAGFLAELEPFLIELAFDAHKNSATAYRRMQREAKDDLLFRVRLVASQLNAQQITT